MPTKSTIEMSFTEEQLTLLIHACQCAVKTTLSDSELNPEDLKRELSAYYELKDQFYLEKIKLIRKTNAQP